MIQDMEVEYYYMQGLLPELTLGLTEILRMSLTQNPLPS